MRAALVVVLAATLALTGCGRLNGDQRPPATPTPTSTQPSTDEVSDLLDDVTTTLDQVNRDLRTGDEAADKE